MRRRHGVPDLTWSEALAADARKWATFLAESDTFEHDYSSMQDKHQGENLAFFKPYKAKCQGPKRDDCVQCREIVDGWYDEVKNYDFGMGKPKTPGGVVMHFTQASIPVGLRMNYEFVTQKVGKKGKKGKGTCFSVFSRERIYTVKGLKWVILPRQTLSLSLILSRSGLNYIL